MAAVAANISNDSPNLCSACSMAVWSKKSSACRQSNENICSGVDVMSAHSNAMRRIIKRGCRVPRAFAGSKLCVPEFGFYFPR